MTEHQRLRYDTIQDEISKHIQGEERALCCVLFESDGLKTAKATKALIEELNAAFKKYLPEEDGGVLILCKPNE